MPPQNIFFPNFYLKIAFDNFPQILTLWRNFYAPKNELILTIFTKNDLYW